MISGKTLTGREVVDQYPVTSLIGRQCVVLVSVLGNGFVDMQLGAIVDPAACVIDEPDGAILYVEYEKDDDYLLASVFEDTPIVLLSEPHLHESDADSWYSFETSTPISKPPVGTVCQFRQAGALGDSFIDCRVVGHFFEKVGCVDLTNGSMEALPLSDFRPAGGPEHPDNHAVDRFAIAMKRKLAAARAKGRSGWNNYQQLGIIHSEIADFAASIDSMMLDPKCTPEVVARRLMDALNRVIPSTTAGHSVARTTTDTEGGAA